VTRDNRGDSDDAEVLADAERGADALLQTDDTGHEEQVHVTALDAAMGRHECSVPGRPNKVNVSDQNYRDLNGIRALAETMLPAAHDVTAHPGSGPAAATMCR
jgi:hypothetical protein